MFRNLSERNTTSVIIHLGCDFHLSYENLLDAIENPRKYTINRRLYLMVELPAAIALAGVRNALHQLRNAGILPILNSPGEKNRSLQMQLAGWRAWLLKAPAYRSPRNRCSGGLDRPRSAPPSFLKADLVHFIASDAHDCVDRTPDLSRAQEYICNHYGGQRADMLLIHNPAAVLRGDPLPTGSYSG